MFTAPRPLPDDPATFTTDPAAFGRDRAITAAARRTAPQPIWPPLEQLDDATLQQGEEDLEQSGPSAGG